MDTMSNAKISSDLAMINFSYFAILLFVIVGLIVAVLFGLFLYMYFKRDSKNTSEIINEGIAGVKKAENEFTIKRAEIENKADAKKQEIEDKRIDDEELINKDPLEYIKRRF